MNDLFDISLAQWYAFETEAVKAAEAVKNNSEDLEFYAQLAQCAAEQAEVAGPEQRSSAIQYLRSKLERLEELLQLKDELEDRASLTRERANAWKKGLREVANF